MPAFELQGLIGYEGQHGFTYVLGQGDAEAGPGPESVAADSSSGEGGAEAVPAQELQRLSARGALAAAHAGTRLPGSSTACVLQLNRAARTICAANLVCPAWPSLLVLPAPCVMQVTCAANLVRPQLFSCLRGWSLNIVTRGQ